MANRMTRIKTVATAVSAVAVLGGLAYGAFLASRSPMFRVKVVEFDGEPVEAAAHGLKPAFETSELQQLADIPVGEISLFELDLDVIRERLIAHEWVRDVELRKILPDTVAITVKPRTPRALIRQKDGTLVYLDSDGRTFGKVDALVKADLPVFAPNGEFPEEDFKQVVRLIETWSGAEVGRLAKLSALSWEAGRGFRALIVYPLMRREGVARSMIEIGQRIDGTLDQKMEHVSKVLKYLVDHSLAAARIWVGDGKKIVVRTTRGS